MWVCLPYEDFVHVVPYRDEVVHDLRDGANCVCGPDIEVMLDGPENDYVATMVTHHSLDGREADE